MSGVNVMVQYQSYFGVASLGGATGLIFSLFYAGAFAAIVSGPFLADTWGRKMPIKVARSLPWQVPLFKPHLSLSNNSVQPGLFSVTDRHYVLHMVRSTPLRWLILSGEAVLVVFS